MSRRLGATLVAAAALVAPLQAQSIVFDNSSPYTVSPGLAGSSTLFNQVGGMAVDWVFTDGSTGSGIWGATGVGGTWGVLSSGFNLYGNGTDDTFNNSWQLIASSLSSFTLQAAPGQGVFDVVSSPEGTPGSGSGQALSYQCAGGWFIVPFCILNGQDYWNTTVTYSNPVGINGAQPVGDLYASLTVSFGTGFNTGGRCRVRRGVTTATGCSSLQFLQDMDNIQAGGNIGALPATVTPEPGTMALLATGLIGMTGAGYRRRRRA